MTSKQLLVLSFLALFLVFADSQSANLSVSLNTLYDTACNESVIFQQIAIQSNVCVNVEFANETECYYKAKDPLTFTITFTRKANKKCKKLVQQLDKQTNITIAAHRCEGRSNSIQAHMSVEQLNWVSTIHTSSIGGTYHECTYLFSNCRFVKDAGLSETVSLLNMSVSLI